MHTLTTTAANVADINEMHKLLQGKEKKSLATKPIGVSPIAGEQRRSAFATESTVVAMAGVRQRALESPLDEV